MSILFGILGWLCQTYSSILFLRFLVELVLGLRRSARLPHLVTVLAELLFTITDPPVRLARRLLPPLRVGQVSLDFGIFLSIFVFSTLGAVFNGLR
ncbi:MULTISPECIES: YggT family protein [unclassified Pseudoclavibacter]|uniref:YggT family protein n=1 Tax=unclassified Pseudoclavibacter TaxID=2615177 RepID=UPI001301450A|nr:MULTISPECIES: YggT family protein [unclassified Pseudoclavibacter]KAB1646451.1 YggT family protein [Pseudoclavibacter sp. CFCC 14310]KAB1663389.1 YggT family protein [Pseudoclavibacter sp. CFCC 13611]